MSAVLGRPRLFALFAAPLALVLLVGEGCESSNAIVGGACRGGLLACGRECVDPTRDPNNCGECGRTCSPLVPCLDSVCGGRLPDGATKDGQTSDVLVSDAPSDGGRVDVQCLPPFDTKEQCGDCDTTCRADQDCLERDGGGFACGPACVPPLVACSGRCVDLQNDPQNCGTCGKFCTSFLCATGLCQGNNPGDTVVIGHDYFTANAATSQARVLVNAVYIPRSNPLRILSYERDANVTAIGNVKSILSTFSFGRILRYTVSRNVADLAAPDLANRFDVILIHDQVNRSPADLTNDATTWATPLHTFGSTGGVVVVLDGATGQGGMPALLTAAQLLDTPGHTPLASLSRVAVVAPVDVIATTVVSPYAGFANTATLQTNEPSGGNVTWVIRAGNDGSGDPVVVHKSVP